MTDAADLLLTDAEAHTLAEPDSAADAAESERASRHADETHEAVAVRDGEIVRVGSAYEVAFLEGVETRVIDCEGRVVLPGFVDAHTHLEMVGQFQVNADLRDVDSPDDAVDRLRETAADGPSDDRDGSAAGIVRGYGYDESTWTESRYLTRADLDRVSTERPVVAFREDMHTASLNSPALERFADEMPDEDVEREGDEPTGVVVEGAVDTLFAATEPDVEETRRLLRAAQDRANELGVTGVHDMCRQSHKPRVFRELDAAGELTLRVRLNYWVDHLDAVRETGLRPGHGSGMVRTGAIKTYTDGALGGRTAKLTEPYADVEAGADADAADANGDTEAHGDATGQWVVGPAALEGMVAEATDLGLQFAAHAIGDAAVAAVLDAYAEHAADETAVLRHRVEHAELVTDELLDRFVDLGAVASVQPNFLKWARGGGLYEARLGDRTTNRFRDLLDAGVPLAFGSDCMPLDPLFGVHQAVTAPDPSQRLDVTEALRAYTRGAAYAGGDEDRLGTVEPGKRADLVVLAESPWEVDSDDVAAIDVDLTVVDGKVVYER
jgi:predicted amidohydrolase YtcJ